MSINTISNLNSILNQLSPQLNEGEYVFCCVSYDFDISLLEIIASCHEKEGLSVLIKKNKADLLGLNYSSILAWISLNVYSDLESVGLTAAVSGLFAKNNISCNVIAAFHHDHLFVPIKDATNAMKLLSDISHEKT